MSHLKPINSSQSLDNGERYFSDFLEGYFDFTANHESTYRLKLWSCISIVAAALERKTYIDRGYYTLFPNMYIFIIGRSGLVKKSTSTAIAVSLFRELEKSHIMSERMTAGSLIQQMHMAGEYFEDNGVRKRQSAVYSYASELSVFLQEVFGSVTEILTTFYDCVPHDCNKPWTYQTIGRGETRIFGPCLNVLGASTRTWLRKCIPVSEMEGGFTSRIMFVVENQLPKKLVPWPELDPALNLLRSKLVHDLKFIHKMVGEFRIQEEAKEWFKNWYETHMRITLPQQSNPKICGYLSRKPDHLLKLSMVRAVMLAQKLLITREHMEWSLKQLDEIETDWITAFEDVRPAASENELQYQILKFLQNQEKLVLKDTVFTMFNSQGRNTLQIKQAISTLCDIGEIKAFRRVENGLTIHYLSAIGVISETVLT